MRNKIIFVVDDVVVAATAAAGAAVLVYCLKRELVAINARFRKNEGECSRHGKTRETTMWLCARG